MFSTKMNGTMDNGTYGDQSSQGDTRLINMTYLCPASFISKYMKDLELPVLMNRSFAVV